MSKGYNQVIYSQTVERRVIFMTDFSQVIQTADWKLEKHVPVIECSSEVASGQMFPVKVTIGKEVAHPNTTGHHIRWISLYFQPEGEKFSHQIGHFEFGSRAATWPPVRMPLRRA